jgi:hypothetical protein
MLHIVWEQLDFLSYLNYYNNIYPKKTEKIKITKNIVYFWN